MQFLQSALTFSALRKSSVEHWDSYIFFSGAEVAIGRLFTAQICNKEKRRVSV